MIPSRSPRPRRLSIAIAVAAALEPGRALAAPTWNEAFGHPNPVSSHAMAFDDARDVIVTYTGTATLEYDGVAWVPGSGAPPTPGRSNPAMTYDAARSRVVAFGGVGAPSTLLSDTWEYDGSTWTSGPAAPPALTPRQRHAMAYDSFRSLTVLFGGHDGAPRNDTWEYDGTAWTPGPAAPPGLVGRSGHAMAYDATDGNVVLFGGSPAGFGCGTCLSDTWEYDGIAWTAGATAPPGLTARFGTAMAFDAVRGVTVLFGGIGAGPVVLGDTWEYDGDAWGAGPATPTGMYARYHAGIAYDGSRDRTVVFGGYMGTPTAADAWELGTHADVVVGMGLGAPNPNRVRVFSEAGNATTVDFLAYGAGAFGVNVAAGGIDADEADEVLTGPGPGDVFGPQVKGFKRDATPMGKVNFYAYGTLKFGVNLGRGGIDGDAFAEILTGPGPGPVFGPQVRAYNFDGGTVAAIAKVNFFAYATLKYGVNVAAGSTDADAFDELQTGPGPGAMFGPTVRGFNYDGATVTAIAKVNFNAFATPQYGVNVAGGDTDGDAFAEIAAAPGPGAGVLFPARFLGFDVDGGAVGALPGFDVSPYPAPYAYGGRVGLSDLTADGASELLAGAGRDPFAEADVHTYAYGGAALTELANGFDPWPGNFFGVNVAGGTLLY